MKKLEFMGWQVTVLGGMYMAESFRSEDGRLEEPRETRGPFYSKEEVENHLRDA